ncbi:hypothetical protein ACC692_37100, partial [Rhizobium ruizarguesonis]
DRQYSLAQGRRGIVGVHFQMQMLRFGRLEIRVRTSDNEQPREKPFIIGKELHRGGALAGIDRGDAIDQQKRISISLMADDAIDIESHGVRC